MIANLPVAAREHRARLVLHVDQFPAVGDAIGNVPPSELLPQLNELCGFLNDGLIPHMEATERAIYPELERLMQNRHSMTPMRREHEQIRLLIDDLVGRRDALAARRFGLAEAVATRRTLFRLHAFLKVHLAEEALYEHLIESGLSADADQAIAAALDHPGAIGA
jgi:hemerythrin HHE cation binding domain-containing protein